MLMRTRGGIMDIEEHNGRAGLARIIMNKKTGSHGDMHENERYG